MKSCRVLCSVFLMVCVVGGPALVFADFIPPDYNDPANNPTRQTWKPLPMGPDPISGEPLPDPIGLTPGEIVRPLEWENPYGEPTIILDGGGDGTWEQEWMNPPGSDPNEPFEPIPTWHYRNDEVGGTGKLIIMLPNSPEQNPEKYLTFSIISDKGLNGNGDPIEITTTYEPPLANPGEASSEWIPAAWKSTQLGGSLDNGAWYQYEGTARITPNPQSETIVFEVTNCTNIAEIEIKTVCIPEPVSIFLLVLGGVAMVWRRRKV